MDYRELLSDRSAIGQRPSSANNHIVAYFSYCAWKNVKVQYFFLHVKDAGMTVGFLGQEWHSDSTVLGHIVWFSHL